MAYYLGKDLDIALMTEHGTKGLVVLETGATGVRNMFIKNWSGSSDTFDSSAHRTSLFAAPRVALSAPDHVSIFGNTSISLQGTQEAWDNRPDNVTALDLSVSTQDEDVQFIGQRNVLKAEVKKENSVTITRKKKDDVWDVAYNEARFGLLEDGTALGDGHSQPDFFGYGYRVALKFKGTTAGEVIVFPNCCITEHTVTVGSDSSTEESLTFVSYVNPIFTDGLVNSVNGGLHLGNADEM